MKKILLSAGLCMLVSFSFAQKKAVKEAKAAMSSDIAQARTLIKPALTDPDTSADPDTWKTAGDIENEAFEKERNNELMQKSPNFPIMYEALYSLYEPYIKADSLAQLPDEKGKVKNKVRKDIIGKLRANHSYYYNGGVYYNENKEYSKASDFFTRYWELPSLNIFENEKDAFNTNDSTFQTIKYYAIICALQANEHQKAISLLNKIKSEEFIPNSTFKESDVYELLASEYETTGDSIKFMAILEEGSNKYPENKYFLPNLINQYIQKGQSDKAIQYLDKAIENNPSSLCDMSSVKASLFAEKQDFEKSDAIYKEVLAKAPNCERALEGLSVSYIVQAQNYKEEASKISGNKERTALDDKAKECYTNAIPLLEKYKSLLESRSADQDQMKGVLVKLQNVYYNLNMDKELDEISNQLENK